MTDLKTEHPICSICQLPYAGYGNNAYPVNEGRCCDTCNNIVIGARINQMRYRDALARQAKAEAETETDPETGE